ncbi:MAG TPA: hypothetical protein VK050_03065 [Flavobacteriaceae bacterium]|nr:hypothetical protein [Flavobacteriaceae bacterium]
MKEERKYVEQTSEERQAENEYAQWSQNQPIMSIDRLNAPSVNEVEMEFINLAAPSKILDVGCGNGRRLFSYLDENGIPYVGIEKFDRLVTIEKYRPNIVITDLLNLDTSNLDERIKEISTVTILGGSFGGLFGLGKHQKAWDILTDILPVGGKVIFDTILINGFETDAELGVMKLFSQAPPQFFLSKLQLKEVWDKANLKIIEKRDLPIMGGRDTIRYYLLEKKD